jgi:peptidoglycan/xylan/chitin deacetylase (PgdA/CDA1 family)
MSTEEQIQEIQKGYQAIADVLGEEPSHVIRAPGGNFYGDIVKTLWPYVDVEVGWDIDTEDWKRPGAEAIAQAILSVQPGQVILMHDGGGDRSQTVEALGTALPQLVEQGYSFVTINELLQYGIPE